MSLRLSTATQERRHTATDMGIYDNASRLMTRREAYIRLLCLIVSDRLLCYTDSNAVRIVVSEWLHCITLELSEDTLSLDAELIAEAVSNVVYTALRETEVDACVTCALVSIA